MATQTSTKMHLRSDSGIGNGSATANGSKQKFSDRSLVGEFNWKDVLVPDDVGTGSTVKYYQRRTMAQYAVLAGLGLYTWYSSENPRIRAAGLGLLFPGAGLVAACSISSVLAFVLSTALIPLVLFAWFGCGGVTFPIVLWTGATALAALLAGNSVWEPAAPLWVAVCIGGIAYIATSWKTADAKAVQKRKERNAYLVDAVQQNQASAKVPEPGSREVDAESLRFLQWTLEAAMAPKDDFSYHDVIDQFQTSAIRYQLYELVAGLGLYQSIYAPNFHGYLKSASENTIEKSLQKQVVGFWAYESMLGKFKFSDWDPCKEDNIMVTGYVLQAVGIYQSNTRDGRYSRGDNLTFEVTDTKKYKYNLRSVAEAVFRNMDTNAYTLYPCEPNWIYTICNLVGISGITVTDRVLGNSYGAKLRERFESALEREFSFPDGSIIPICSELTGFTIPGLAGALSDAGNAVLCAAYLPHIAHRNWAMAKKENLTYDANGRLHVDNLIGADKLDAGNYKAGEGAIRAVYASSAAEFGDDRLRKDLLEELDTKYHPVFTTKTGAMKNKGLSSLMQGSALRARIAGYQDWCKMIQKGPPEHVFKAPVLDKVAFPDVLVAKAWSQDGESVDLVLYNGKAAGTFDLGFKRMKAGKTYKLGGKTATADKNGEASFKIAIDGRTAIKLELA